MNRFCTLSHKRVNLFHLPSDSFMDTLAAAPAAIAQPTPQELALSGAWTARGVGAVVQQLESLRIPAGTKAIAECARIEALDTAGAWVLQKLLLRLRDEGTVVTVRGLRPEFARLLEVVAQRLRPGRKACACRQPAPYGARKHRPERRSRFQRGLRAAEFCRRQLASAHCRGRETPRGRSLEQSLCHP